MAVEPLFVENTEVLRSALKLSGASQPDTATAIDNAMRRVRAMIYDRLGASRVGTVLGYTRSENPTNTNELLRTRAELLEIDWVKLILLRDLPVLFMDGSENVPNRWNDEELTREARPSDLDKMIVALEESINDGIEALSGSSRVGRVSAMIGEPDTVPPRPGDSVRYPWRLKAGVIL